MPDAKDNRYPPEVVRAFRQLEETMNKTDLYDQNPITGEFVIDGSKLKFQLMPDFCTIGNVDHLFHCAKDYIDRAKKRKKIT